VSEGDNFQLSDACNIYVAAIIIPRSATPFSSTTWVCCPAPRSFNVTYAWKLLTCRPLPPFHPWHPRQRL